MSKMAFNRWALTLAVAAGGWAAMAGEPPEAPQKPSRGELREQLRNLPPEERKAKIKEWRERPGPTPTDEFEKRREMFKNLSPEEREAKLKEWREKAGHEGQAGNPRNMTPEQREAKRKEIRQRVEKELEALQKKKTDGTLTDEEGTRLRRLEMIQRRFEQGSARPPGRESGGERRASGSPEARPTNQPPTGRQP